MDRAGVLTARLATQRLAGPPAAGPAQVVRELLCVQSQDALLACGSGRAPVRPPVGAWLVMACREAPQWGLLDELR